MISEQELILRFGTATAIGLIVGMERGWRERDAAAGSRTAGVRTFALCGLLGAILAALGEALSSALVLAAGFATFAAVFSAFTYAETRKDGTFSVTGTVAGLTVFCLGALCVVGSMTAAAAAGVGVAGLLASRERLHGLLSRLTWRELRSALLLLSMSVIVLPLLPDRPLDPFGSVNPREIWIFTVLTAALSYAGYIATKLAGPARGLAISSLAGGLISSTAITVALARRARSDIPAGPLAGGAALAGMVSALRGLTLATIVAPSLFAQLAMPVLVGAAIFGGGGAYLLARSARHADAGVADPGNPFDLLPLLAFAGVLALVSLCGGWMTTRYGSGSIFGTAAVFGLADIDVAVLTTARLVGQTLSSAEGAQAVLLSLGVNAAARSAYAFALGSAGFAVRLMAITLVAVGAAAIAAFMPLA
jgi:uncharacterized membrane protein (DUF4010 family)